MVYAELVDPEDSLVGIAAKMEQDLGERLGDADWLANALDIGSV